MGDELLVAKSWSFISVLISYSVDYVYPTEIKVHFMVSLILPPVYHFNHYLAFEWPIEVFIMLPFHNSNKDWDMSTLTTSRAIGIYSQTHFVAFLVCVKWSTGVCKMEYCSTDCQTACAKKFCQGELVEWLGMSKGILPRWNLGDLRSVVDCYCLNLRHRQSSWMYCVLVMELYNREEWEMNRSYPSLC